MKVLTLMFLVRRNSKDVDEDDDEDRIEDALEQQVYRKVKVSDWEIMRIFCRQRICFLCKSNQNQVEEDKNDFNK